MLYSEFLNGTYEPDNKWTYKEYKRIEAIYNNSDTMTKEEAYKLFREPDSFTLELLNDIEILRAKKSDLYFTTRNLEKENTELKKQLEKSKYDYETLQKNVYTNALHLCNLTRA